MKLGESNKDSLQCHFILHKTLKADLYSNSFNLSSAKTKINRQKHYVFTAKPAGSVEVDRAGCSLLHLGFHCKFRFAKENEEVSCFLQ